MNQPPGPGPYGQPGYSQPSHSQPSHYSQAPRGATPGGAYGAAAYAPPAAPYDPNSGRYGDKALEHLTMKRGRYNAWTYVVLAFLMEAALLFCIFGLPIGFGLGAVTKNDQVLTIATLAVGLPAGIGGSYLLFRDRWRCNEAFSSRFCVGIMNISIMFVPLVALVYANVRGVQKVFGK